MPRLHLFRAIVSALSLIVFLSLVDAGLLPRNNNNAGSLTPWCPRYPISKDGRCGKLFGWTRCPDGQCCSQWNYCSSTETKEARDRYCGAGCQLGYGQCYTPTSNSTTGYSTPDIFCRDPPAATGTWSLLTTSTATATWPVLPSCTNYPSSTNGRCGEAFGFTKCPTYEYNGVGYPSCCSKYNFCWDPKVGMEQRSAYCASENCQPGFGACDDKGSLAVVPCRVDINPTSSRATYTFITVNGPSTTSTASCAPNCLTTVTITVTSGRPTKTTASSTPPPTFTSSLTTMTNSPTITSAPTLTTRTGTLTVPTDIGTNYVTATYKVDLAYPPSTDGMCGPAHGNTRCGTDDLPGCCGGDSECFQPPVEGSFNETSVALTSCGAGCQQNFGVCWAAFIRRGQQCGPGFGPCPENICCGGSGYCQDDGATDGVAWCGCDCQRGFGKCFDGYGPEVCNATRTTSSLTATPVPTAVVLPNLDLPTAVSLRCGLGFGGTRCPNNLCCSAASFCQNDGGTDGFAWCGCGCQFGVGSCFLYEPDTCPGVVTSSTEGLTVVPWPTSTQVPRALPTGFPDTPTESEMGEVERERKRKRGLGGWLWSRFF